MRVYRNAVLIALLGFHIGAQAQLPLERPSKEDIVCIVYEFELTPDGKAHNIKVSQIFWQKDRSDASGALTQAEKERGAAFTTLHQYHPRPDQVGKKRYDFVLFDTKSRNFDRGTRP
jgi:hypothetical protein